MKTLTCPRSAGRIIHCTAAALAVFAGFISGGTQAAHADPFLDEIVEFTGQVLC